jgi:hypothetical protein
MTIRSFAAALFICILIMTAPTPAARAAEPAPAKGGVSFRLGAGAGYVVSNDQLRPNDGNQRVRDLDDNADRFDAVIPLVNFDLRYTFGDSGRQLYLGTPMGEDGPPALTLGGVWPLADGTRIDLGIMTMPFGQVWEDPYLVGEDRDATDQDTYGIKIDVDRIMGTAFEAGYSLKHIDVDDDAIGRRFDDLARDGWVHAARLGYAFEVGAKFELVPQAGLTWGDIDGDANRYRGCQIKLGLRRFDPEGLLNLAASVGYRDYDETHPVFDKTREDITYSLFGLYTRPNLFGWPPVFATVLAGYTHRDANIDFLEADTLVSGLMVGYRF